MTLKPIPGAPLDAPIPDFPTGAPAPLAVPESRFTRGPVPPVPSSLAPSELSPARPPGPVEIRGDGGSILTFRAIPEVPALYRSSMTIAITGEQAGDHSSRTMTILDLPADRAKAFLLALRDGDAPIFITDSRTGFHLEFAIAGDGPAFTAGKPGQEGSSRRFNLGWSFDAKTMAAHLLTDLGL